jgi:hypothetical protein
MHGPMNVNTSVLLVLLLMLLCFVGRLKKAHSPFVVNIYTMDLYKYLHIFICVSARACARARVCVCV